MFVASFIKFPIDVVFNLFSVPVLIETTHETLVLLSLSKLPLH